MSNYPAWWNATVTVYNKYEDPTSRRVTWYRTVLHNCFWKYTGNKIVVGQTALETDTTICRIPTHRAFLDAYQWYTQEDKSQYFTISAGDILIKGEVTDEIDEYTAGQRSSDILTKCKKSHECMVVDKCSVNVGPGRGLEHYYVRGV